MVYMIHFILYRMSFICYTFESTGYKYLYNLIFFFTQFAFRFKFYSNKGGNQGRIQDLWLGGAWVGEGSGDRLRSPAGPRQSHGRGPRGRSPLETLELWGITDIYFNDNFEPTTPFLSDQKSLTLSLNFVG